MLRYGIEDNVELAEPVDVFREKILCPMNFTGIMRMLAQNEIIYNFNIFVTCYVSDALKFLLSVISGWEDQYTYIKV